MLRDGSVFLRSILWTALAYNPVRILGLLGLAGVGLAALIVMGLIGVRLSGVTELGPWGVAGLYGALVLGVSGVSVFSLDVTFNYLVSLFYKRPVRQGLLGQPILKTPLDRQLGWLGLVSTAVGVVGGVASLTLGLKGWDIARLWLYLLGSAIAVLIGVQLVIYWILLRVLEELSQREIRSLQDSGVAHQE